MGYDSIVYKDRFPINSKEQSYFFLDLTRADFNLVYEKWSGRPLNPDWQNLDLTVQKQSFKGSSWCGAVTLYPEGELKVFI